jgi:hypothetical protein
MDGEPVYIADLNSPQNSQWEIIHGTDRGYDPDLFHFRNAAYHVSSYGKTWLAYTRKPEALSE